jgi:SAM-dependent methyltransferase
LNSYISRYAAESTIDSLLAQQNNDPGMAAYISGHRERLIKTLLTIPLGENKLSVLDVGTTGFMLSLFKNLLGYKEVAGILWKESGAPSASRLEYSGDFFPVAYLDAEKDIYPFADGSVDLITCFEVIEHFTCDPMLFLEQARRVLKQDGTLVISTPNSASYEALVSLCRGEPPMLFYKFVQGSSDRHHIEYTPKLLGDLVKAAGFKIIALETIDDKPEVRRANSDLFLQAESFIKQVGYSAELRDRRIYLVASNARGSFCRYPDFMYHPS